ncbi:transcriptional regulator, partial [Rhizobium sp. M10]
MKRYAAAQVRTSRPAQAEQSN